MKKRIVVTGIGLVTSLGNTREKTWAAICAGKSGIQPDSQGLHAPVWDYVMDGTRSRVGDFALTAAQEALHHAGIDRQTTQSMPVGCAVSQSKPILYGHSGPAGLDPALLLSSFTGWSSESVIKNEWKLSGPSGNVVAACATGIAALQLGCHWIESDQCDIALVGASEASLNPLYRTGFQQMGVLAEGSKPNAVRPFDRNRCGFAIGEGAAVLVIESMESANKRGQPPICEVGSVCLQHSSKDPIRFDDQGTAVARLMTNLLKNNSQVDYINAHGTATLYNDVVETRGLRTALGDAAESVSISSTKAATGHLLGAAGALEAALTVLALRDQIAPPTLNLTETDPECDLDYVPLTARKQKVQTAISLSYGFGGQMGGVLFKKC